MYYIPRGNDDDPESTVQDDEEDEVLDFVFDGRVRYASAYASEGRSLITKLRTLVEDTLVGQGDVDAIGNALNGLLNRVDQAIAHYRNLAQQRPDDEFCAANLGAYLRAHDGVVHMLGWMNNRRQEQLTHGMGMLELAVADVDALVEEEEARRGNRA